MRVYRRGRTAVRVIIAHNERKQSALVRWIPRAVRSGAEVRELAMVGRIVTNGAGLATGVEYQPDGRW
jgi:hypothetical protein